MSDLGQIIAEQVRAALRDATGGRHTTGHSTGGTGGQTTASVVTNVGSGESHSVSVYTDGHVTIVERDGKRHVINHDEDDAAATSD